MRSRRSACILGLCESFNFSPVCVRAVMVRFSFSVWSKTPGWCCCWCCCYCFILFFMCFVFRTVRFLFWNSVWIFFSVFCRSAFRMRQATDMHVVFQNENDREKHKTINTRKKKKTPRLHFTKVNLNAYNTCIEMVGEPEYASTVAIALCTTHTTFERKHFRNFRNKRKKPYKVLHWMRHRHSSSSSSSSGRKPKEKEKNTFLWTWIAAAGWIHITFLCCIGPNAMQANDKPKAISPHLVLFGSKNVFFKHFVLNYLITQTDIKIGRRIDSTLVGLLGSVAIAVNTYTEKQNCRERENRRRRSKKKCRENEWEKKHHTAEII